MGKNFKKLVLAVLLIFFLCAGNAFALGWLPYRPVPTPAPTPPEEVIHNPILMFHGLFGNPSNWDKMKAYLVNYGYDESLIFTPAMPENFTMCSETHLNFIATQIALVKDQTGADKVDLVGHSRGGTDIMNFLWDGDGDEDVAKVITIAGANKYNCSSVYGPIPQNEVPGDTAYTSIYSTSDFLVRPATAILNGAENIEVQGPTHVSIISDAEVEALVAARLAE